MLVSRTKPFRILEEPFVKTASSIETEMNRDKWYKYLEVGKLKLEMMYPTKEKLLDEQAEYWHAHILRPANGK